MRLSASLKARMILLFVILVGTLLACAYLSSYFVFKRVIKADFDQRLVGASDVMIADLIADSNDKSDGEATDIATDVRDLVIPGAYFELFDQNGRLLQRSTGLVDRDLPLPAPSFANSPAFQELSDAQQGHLRAILRPFQLNSKRYILVLAMSEQDVQKSLSNFKSLILLLALPSLLLTACVSFWYVSRSLRPVSDLTEHAEETMRRLQDPKSDEVWTPFVISDPKDELGRLADSLNRVFVAINASVRQLRQFATDASHELRTPLTVLQCEAELILSRPRTEPEYRVAIETLLGELHKLSRIVQGLFTLCLADAGQLRPAQEPIYLQEILHDSCNFVEPLATARILTIIRQSPVLNPVDIPMNGDETLLRQLFVIFLDNAVKYSRPGGEIRVVLEASPQTVVVSFIDNGIGIAPEHLPHIFQRFYRAAPGVAGETLSGGLGLPIAEAIAKAHGGSIECLSECGVGTTFKIRLPRDNATVKSG